MTSITINGAGLPSLGLGTMRLKGPQGYDATRHGLEIGYRHIDTAQKYDNEEDVGRAIQDSPVPRDEIFLTTKVDVANAAPADVRSSTEVSLEKLGTDYVDLLMLHWPSHEVALPKTLGAMAAVADEGLARHLGVCNFPHGLLMQALDLAPVFAHQVEYHPFLGQQRLLSAAREHGHALVAYCPLARGKVLDDPTLVDIADGHGKGPAQVALRWLIQQPHVAAIPGSGDPQRQSDNLDVFDFELSAGEMERIFALDRQERVVDPPHAPDWDA